MGKKVLVDKFRSVIVVEKAEKSGAPLVCGDWWISIQRENSIGRQERGASMKQLTFTLFGHFVKNVCSPEADLTTHLLIFILSTGMSKTAI